MNFKDAQDFAATFVAGAYASEEHAAFLQWMKEATADELTIIADTYELNFGVESNYGNWVVPVTPSAEWVTNLERKLDVSGEDREEVTVMGGRESGVRWLRLTVWLTAASVVAVSAGLYFYAHQTGAKSPDEAGNGNLLSMNLSVPRGEAQRELTLEDGSKIWLNPGSSLKYPAHFTGNERVVELSGEAFFDVTSNAQDPFRVLIKDAKVDVLGTYFSIMAYDDEPVSRTTLAEGSLKVVNGQQNIVLKPGDQIELVYGSGGVGDEIIVHAVDPKSVLTWKGGIYIFQGKQLHEVMRELARVYNVTVQYQPNVGNPAIDGALDLKKGLDSVLKILESAVQGMKGIQFKHAGKTIIVSSSI